VDFAKTEEPSWNLGVSGTIEDIVVVGANLSLPITFCGM